MSIFLHFLNREPYRAANTSLNTKDVEFVVRVLAVATTDLLFTNYSNLYEGGFMLAPASLFRHLLESNQLLVYAERPTAEEFLESRRAKYSYDRNRYPMYFSDTETSADVVTPNVVKRNSATEGIADDIEAMRKGNDLGILLPKDKEIVTNALPKLTADIRKREERAITISLFADTMVTREERGATARLISSIYIRQHLVELDADMATGVKALSSFDHLARRPGQLDIPILSSILKAIGLGDLLKPPANEAVSLQRADTAHHVLVVEIERLKAALIPEDFSLNQISALRFNTHDLIARTQHANQSIAIGSSMYVEAIDNIRHLITALAKVSRPFAARLAEIDEKTDSDMPVILLLTAASVETEALLGSFHKKFGKTSPRVHSKKNYIASEVGHIAGARVLSVQCEAGSGGVSNAQAVVSDVIADFDAAYVICGGIAFGANKDKQNMGDILISKMVWEYEKEKVQADKRLFRGQKAECSPKLLSIFRSAEARNFSSARVHVGTFLSGEKLIDSKDFLQELLQREPEAIGGEMEGSGVAAAASRAKKDWIVVKAIVDWGFEKSASNGREHQLKIARVAFDFIFDSLNQISEI